MKRIVAPILVALGLGCSGDKPAPPRQATDTVQAPDPAKHCRDLYYKFALKVDTIINNDFNCADRGIIMDDAENVFNNIQRICQRYGKQGFLISSEALEDLRILTETVRQQCARLKNIED